jgi:hypothetical protein
MQEKQSFDIDSIVDELDQEFTTEAEDQLEEPVEDGEDEIFDPEEQVVADGLEDDSLEDEELDEEETVDEPEPEKPVNDDDVHKRNEAFRKLREERDALATSDKFLEDLAIQYGLTKEQLITRFKEDQIKRQAKEQGIPEDQLRKMQEMETRLAQVEETKAREIFNIKAEALVTKHNLNEQQMMTIFQEAARLGLDVTRNPDLLEFAYRAVNYDNAINEGRQKQLETSKKRRATSTGKTGTQGKEPVRSDEEVWDKEIDALLKDLNL